MKAFDCLEWPFLWLVLEEMGFGIPNIDMINVLHKNPTAVVLISKNCSTSFAISRGSRQGYPLSPLLFALSLEPIAQTIRQSPALSRSLLMECIIISYHSLYADDVLLYVNTVQGIPQILSIFDQYGKLSEFEIKYLLLLRLAMTSASITTFIPVVRNFTSEISLGFKQ